MHSLFLFGESSSGIGALGVDGKALIIQLITFGLAYLVLRRYAFGPIMRVMNERRDTIEKGVKLGEQMQKEKAELEAKVEKTLHETRAQADAMLAEAQDAGRQAVREAEEKAKQKAHQILTAADERIEQDTKRARVRLQKELIGLVGEATEAIIEEKVDARKDVELIERALKERSGA